MTPKQQKSCGWMIAPIGRLSPVRQCGAPATHYCPDSDAQYCRQHSEDYADVFGDESLCEWPIEEDKP